MWMLTQWVIWMLLVPGFVFAADPLDREPWKASEESPGRDVIVEYFRNKRPPPGQPPHEIWLAPRNNDGERALLFRHNRGAEVIFSPDEKWLAVNDYERSDFAEVRLFRWVEGVKYEEVKEARISEKVWEFFAKQNNLTRPPELHHRYVAAVRWASNSKAFLVSAWGFGDIGQGLQDWFCIFNVGAMKPTLDLNVMNRGALLQKKKGRE